MEVATHVRINKDIKKKLKVMAMIKDTSFKTLLNIALKEYIDREENGGRNDEEKN